MVNSQYYGNIKTNIDPHDKYILMESDNIYNSSNVYAEYFEIDHLSTLGHFQLHEIEQATHLVYSMTPVLRSRFKPQLVNRQQNLWISVVEKMSQSVLFSSF